MHTFSVGQYYTISYNGSMTMQIKILDIKVPTLVQNMSTYTKYFIDVTQQYIQHSESHLFKDGDKDIITYTPHTTLSFINSFDPILPKRWMVKVVVTVNNVSFEGMTTCFRPKPVVAYGSGGSIAIGNCAVGNADPSWIPTTYYNDPQCIFHITSVFPPKEFDEIMTMAPENIKQTILKAKEVYPKSFSFGIEECERKEYTVIYKSTTLVHKYFCTTFEPSTKSIAEFFATAKDVTNTYFCASGWVEKGHVEPFDMNVVKTTTAASNEIKNKIKDLQKQISQLQLDEGKLWEDNLTAKHYKDLYQDCFDCNTDLQSWMSMTLLETLLSNLEGQKQHAMFYELDRINNAINTCKNKIKVRALSYN